MSGKEENSSLTSMQTRLHTLFTDHRASSVHFNILFICVYRCALLERWCVHQPVEPHTFNLLWLVSVTAVHAGAAVTRPENDQGLSNNVRQRGNLEDVGKTRTFVQN